MPMSMFFNYLTPVLTKLERKMWCRSSQTLIQDCCRQKCLLQRGPIYFGLTALHIALTLCLMI
uniref:Uncharacterized protein n=1 Tax=Arundo donax TaxID=35708 RepID=A0A0A8YVX7_ARUDO